MLYYLPEADRSITAAAARAAGLAHAFPDEGITACGVRGGPDAADGVVFANPTRVDSGGVGYYPKHQLWRRVPGRPTWVGLDTAAAAGPDDLAQAEQLDGHLVPLADGRVWLVPIARAWRQTDEGPRYHTALPQLSTLDADGRWVSGQVDARYRALWDVATRWHDAKFAAVDSDDDSQGAENCQEIVITFDDLHASAVTALAANYALAAAEVSLLGLLSDRACATILDALIDWPGLVAILKKKASDTSSSNAGPGGSTPATGPR